LSIGYDGSSLKMQRLLSTPSTQTFVPPEGCVSCSRPLPTICILNRPRSPSKPAPARTLTWVQHEVSELSVGNPERSLHILQVSLFLAFFARRGNRLLARGCLQISTKNERIGNRQPAICACIFVPGCKIRLEHKLHGTYPRLRGSA
jgi:hypothetical protein